MASLYFFYGVMGSSKTAQALMANYNYEYQGQHPLLVKTDTDTRDGKMIVRSRIGIERSCVLLSDICALPLSYMKQFDAIIVDEIQFATKQQIDFLSDIVDFAEVLVMCYGLRTDFQGNLFEGSKRLMEVADKIQEIKTTCWCGKKATFNARFDEDGIIKSGDQVQLGGNDSYIGLCRLHYKMGAIKKVPGLMR